LHYCGSSTCGAVLVKYCASQLLAGITPTGMPAQQLQDKQYYQSLPFYVSRTFFTSL
jgi:hypothetical protein